jgi:hypothetical protein
MDWQQENGRQETDRARADDVVLLSGDAEVRLGVPFHMLARLLGAINLLSHHMLYCSSTRKYTRLLTIVWTSVYLQNKQLPQAYGR